MDSMILTGITGVAAAITALLTIWNFFQSPAKKNAADLEALGAALGKKFDNLSATLTKSYQDVDDKVDAVAARVGTLETVIKYMPDKDSMHELEVSLVRNTEQMKSLSSKLDANEHLSRRLQNMILAGEKE